MLCHLYEAEGTKQKQYYTKVDYAYLNLFCSSKEWIVKGTTEHGIRSLGDKKSRVPCLNCYQVNDDFYEALEKHCRWDRRKYEFGLVLNKRALRKHFGESNVRDVELWDHRDRRPPPRECWLYDIATARRSIIPFNYCLVVRIRMKAPRNLYGLPIKPIPRDSIMGLLVKEEGYSDEAVSRLLSRKK